MLGCGGFQGKGVGMVRGSRFRTEGRLGVTGYGGVQGRGLGEDNRVWGVRGNGIHWVPERLEVLGVVV